MVVEQVAGMEGHGSESGGGVERSGSVAVDEDDGVRSG